MSVAWDQADAACLDTKQVEKLQVLDEGKYDLPPGSLKNKKDQAENEIISITRINQVTPRGGGRRLHLSVSIVNSVDVLVAATGI